MLIGDKIKLRAIYKSDLDKLLKLYREPDIMSQLESRADISLGYMEKQLESTTDHHFRGEWLVIEDLDGNIIGSVSYNSGWKNDFIIYNLYIGSEYQNKGYGTDAIRRLYKFFFEEKRTTRVEAVMREDNQKAIRAFEKASFKHEGKRRKSSYHKGVYMDEVFMSITAKEYFI